MRNIHSHCTQEYESEIIGNLIRNAPQSGAFPLCVRTHILIEKIEGAKRPFFEGEGVQNRVIVILP